VFTVPEATFPMPDGANITYFIKATRTYDELTETNTIQYEIATSESPTVSARKADVARVIRT